MTTFKSQKYGVAVTYNVLQAQNAYLEDRAADLTLQVAKENLAAAKLNLQISREKFEAGAINSFNFRDVQNIYLNVAQRELQAIYNFIDIHTSLLRMTGTIIQEYE